ncbi:MAG: hypothetical protein MUF31_02785 [Akkermansiaceae bacterium]|jgi:hypothetical protein|nr:hypothetical protein [Akkermansiaceae bacterium]
MKKREMLMMAAALAVVSCKPKEESRAAGSAGAGAAAGETAPAAPDSWALAVTEFAPKVGTVIEHKSVNGLKDGSFKMEMQGQAVEGTMNMNDTKEIKFEVVAADRIRVEVTVSEEKQEMIMNGQTMPTPPKNPVLLGKTFFVVKGAEGWAAQAEDGSALPDDQAAEAEKIVKRITGEGDDKLYGTEARKPGDTWTVEGNDLPFLDGAESSEGKATFTFDKIGEHGGMQCAFLSGTVEMSGKPEEMQEGMEGKLKMTGKVTIIRSIEHHLDLAVDLTGELDATMNMPVGTMTMGGPMEMKLTNTVK